MAIERSESSPVHRYSLLDSRSQNAEDAARVWRVRYNTLKVKARALYTDNDSLVQENCRSVKLVEHMRKNWEEADSYISRLEKGIEAHGLEIADVLRYADRADDEALSDAEIAADVNKQLEADAFSWLSEGGWKDLGFTRGGGAGDLEYTRFVLFFTYSFAVISRVKRCLARIGSLFVTCTLASEQPPRLSPAIATVAASKQPEHPTSGGGRRFRASSHLVAFPSIAVGLSTLPDARSITEVSLHMPFSASLSHVAEGHTKQLELSLLRQADALDDFVRSSATPEDGALVFCETSAAFAMLSRPRRQRHPVMRPADLRPFCRPA
ncbi:hypothetical protein BV25DRAFT_1843698 [Artomyces pyxidatus]|uniref:Uncharacterized protein n=1 Tax=Artomyces pyxidatus TaxID=48021 RepID=A0ACB8SES5_9AGAM|nr:hypothetical protein BV25DRAFT_1843698 [Artomyces pyxidatus]